MANNGVGASPRNGIAKALDKASPIQKSSSTYFLTWKASTGTQSAPFTPRPEGRGFLEKLMKALFSMSILVALASAPVLGNAQPTNPLPKKPIAQTSCKEYLEMDEVIKPKFIFYTAGYSYHGKSVSPTLDFVGVDKMKPVIDEYCRVHLTASAYQKVMEESMASEKTNK